MGKGLDSRPRLPPSKRPSGVNIGNPAYRWNAMPVPCERPTAVCRNGEMKRTARRGDVCDPGYTGTAEVMLSNRRELPPGGFEGTPQGCLPQRVSETGRAARLRRQLVWARPKWCYRATVSCRAPVSKECPRAVCCKREMKRFAHACDPGLHGPVDVVERNWVPGGGFEGLCPKAAPPGAPYLYARTR